MRIYCYIHFQGGNVHLNMAINVLAEIPSYLACMFILDKSGRRPILIGTQLGNETFAKKVSNIQSNQIDFSFRIGLSYNSTGSICLGTLASCVIINTWKVCNLSCICFDLSSGMFPKWIPIEW